MTILMITLQKILISTLIIINITRKGLGNIILIPCESARYDFTIVYRRILIVIVDFLQTHRSPARQEIYEIEAFF